MTCRKTQAMLVPPVVEVTSLPDLIRAGTTSSLKAQKGRRM